MKRKECVGKERTGGRRGEGREPEAVCRRVVETALLLICLGRCNTLLVGEPVGERPVIDSVPESLLGQLGPETKLVTVPVADDQVHTVRVPLLQPKHRPHKSNVPVSLVDGISSKHEFAAVPQP